MNVYVAETEDGRTIEFGRLTHDGWDRWRARLAARDRRRVLKSMLRDRAADPENVPVQAVYKSANAELTRYRPDSEVRAFVCTSDGLARRMLVEQAIAGGSDPDEAASIVDAMTRDDREETATLLVNEATIELPLLLPLTRHRARAAARLAAARARERTKRLIQAWCDSVMRSTPVDSGRASA